MESAVIEVPDRDPEYPIIVTEAGADSLVLASLVRQAIPILENPSSYLPAMRRKLAGLMRSALEVTASEDDTDGMPDDKDAPPNIDDLHGHCLEGPLR
jgi:hypothetical protein